MQKAIDTGAGRETIHEFCLRLSREAIRLHESGQCRLSETVLDHHKARVKAAEASRQERERAQ